MKKILLALVISAISFNANAFEQVIGLSGGYSYSQSDFTHSIKSKYKNDRRQDEEKLFANSKKNSGNGFNVNLEYQARFDAYDVKNLFTAGVGYTNENIVLRNTYQNMKNTNAHLNDIYFLGMVTLAQTENFNLKLGATLGNGFFNINKFEGYDKLSSNLLLDTEYSVSEHVMVFSRISYLIYGKREFSSKTDMVFDEAINHTNNQILENKIRQSPLDQLVRINVGVRYKI